MKNTLLAILLIVLIISSVILYNMMWKDTGEGFTHIVLNGDKYIVGDKLELDESCQDCFTLSNISTDGDLIIEYKDQYTSANGFGDPSNCTLIGNTSYKMIISSDNDENCVYKNSCEERAGFCFVDFEFKNNYIKLNTNVPVL